jgi:RNA polymerase sigma-70 factor (ECF subfamily)
LISAALKGSSEAFANLVGSYQGGLLRFLVTRTASFADAEDALQDTLINAYRYLHSYDASWRFSTWLYRIAVNSATRQRRAATVEIADVGDEEEGPLQQCIAESERENLWVTAQRLLADEVYTAMWLRYVEDMSINDIAAVLERSVSWTKVNLLRGRRALESEMNEQAEAGKSEAYG